MPIQLQLGFPASKNLRLWTTGISSATIMINTEDRLLLEQACASMGLCLLIEYCRFVTQLIDGCLVLSNDESSDGMMHA